MRAEQKIARTLTRQRKTLAAAESCTGGLLGHTLTNVPGSSRFFYLGIVAYDNGAKKRLLKVPAGVLARHGAVSPQVAILMARNVRRILKTDLGLGITGIAGPTGGTKAKPVGLVYVAASDGKEITCREFRFKGGRAAIKQKAVAAALRLVLTLL